METVVLLHPGGTDSSAMAATAAGLAGRFEVRAPDRRHEAFPAMARATMAWLEAGLRRAGRPRRPQRRRDRRAPGRTGPARPRPAARVLVGRTPPPGWLPGVELAERHATEPALAEELARIAVPTLVMAADRDEMPLEHTAAMFRALPGAQLAIVPGTDHGSLADRPELCNAIIAGFLNGVGPPVGSRA